MPEWNVIWKAAVVPFNSVTVPAWPDVFWMVTPRMVELKAQFPGEPLAGQPPVPAVKVTPVASPATEPQPIIRAPAVSAVLPPTSPVKTLGRAGVVHGVEVMIVTLPLSKMWIGTNSLWYGSLLQACRPVKARASTVKIPFDTASAIAALIAAHMSPFMLEV